MRRGRRPGITFPPHAHLRSEATYFSIHHDDTQNKEKETECHHVMNKKNNSRIRSKEWR